MTGETPVTTRFNPDQLRRVETMAEIRSLPPDSEGVFVLRLDDEKLAAIVECVSGVRYLIADGSTRVTDTGLRNIARLDRLECLDLEWSAITDQGLSSIAQVLSLQWVDLGFCKGVSSNGLAEMRRLRPDLEIVDTAG